MHNYKILNAKYSDEHVKIYTLFLKISSSKYYLILPYNELYEIGTKYLHINSANNIFM